MCSHKIFNTLKVCHTLNLDFFIIFKNFNEKYKYTPTFTYDIDSNTNLPIILSIYDQDWDEMDDIIFDNISECIPIINSHL